MESVNKEVNLTHSLGDVGTTTTMGACGSKDEPNLQLFVCNESDIEDGQMKVFNVENFGDVLVVKENGKFSVLGTKCTHYGAPLVNGILSNGTIRCQWHGACFSAATGDIEDFPGLDCLPCYNVKTSEGRVTIEISADKQIITKRQRPMKAASLNASSGIIIIIGGGAAGQSCAETLRYEGFDGRIIMITQDDYLPYDRPKLSKAMNAKISDIQLRPDDFYKKYYIETILKSQVSSIDTLSKIVKLESVDLHYDKLLISTGGIPRKHLAKGSNLNNIFYLRTLKDANNIAKISENKKVAIIGTSFIALEVAAFLTGKASLVQVVGRSSVPFAQIFGEKIGRKIQEMFENKGVEFYLKNEVQEFIGDKNDNLLGISISDEVSIPADVCVIGIGVTPATEFLKDTLEMNKSGFIKVNKYLQTNVSNIYAAGDIAYFPLKLANKHVSIGHWQIASKHGRTAALNMLNKNEEISTVPFFWSVLFGKSIRYAGYCDKIDNIIYDMDEESQNFSFIAYYIQDKIVSAVATLNRDPLAAKFASLLSTGKIYSQDDIQANPLAKLDILTFKSEQNTHL